MPTIALGYAAFSFVLTLIVWPGILGALLGLVGAAFVGLIAYASLPTLASDFYDLPLLLFVAALPTLLGMVMSALNNRELDRTGIPALAVATVALAWVLTLAYSSLGFRNEEGYRNIMEVTEKPLDSSVELIDQSHARLVDQDLAKRRALELLGVEKGLGSSYSIGTPTVQVVAGKQVWVAPLEPATLLGSFKGTPTPGYVVVSATNYSDARIVLDHPIVVSKDMWFGANVERVAWLAAPGIGQEDHSFEIDDAGRPYWIVSLYDHAVGASGGKVSAVMLVDASNGQTRTYRLGEEPAWIDRVQPEDMASDQLTTWGDYVHGYWNWEKKDVVHPTPGMSLVYLRDGRSAWFTGIVNARSQSQNSAATNGFALIDTRSGKATVYYKQGISEGAAKGAIEGAVQRDNYYSTNPIAYLVHGALTYVSTLKDKAGNPRGIGMVSALDRSVVATGISLDDVTRAYAARLRTAADRVTNLGVEAKPVTLAGKLVRSGAYVLEGRSYQLVRVDIDGKDRDFTIDLAVGPLRQIVLGQPGDGIEIEVLATQDGTDEVRSVKIVPAG